MLVQKDNAQIRVRIVHHLFVLARTDFIQMSNIRTHVRNVHGKRPKSVVNKSQHHLFLNQFSS